MIADWTCGRELSLCLNANVEIQISSLKTKVHIFEKHRLSVVFPVPFVKQQIINNELVVLKFTLVFDNDTTVHDVHTYTVAFSPPALIKCSICSYHPLTRTPHGWLKKTIHGI